MNLVFYKQSFPWPLRQGATIHSGNLMRELIGRGHQIQLWTAEPISDEARQWLGGVRHSVLRQSSDTSIKLGYWSNRYRQYWGTDEALLSGLEQRVSVEKPYAVIGVGPEVLPALTVCHGTRRVWYSADDPVLHQVSLGGLSCFKSATTMAIYQAALARISADSTWVVSESDRRWSRAIGRGQVDWLPNGIDCQHFRPDESLPTEPNSCVFWGNLSFRPNHDAVMFLISKIWPVVSKRVPNAQLWVCGCLPSDALREKLTNTEGVTFYEDLPDLRDRVQRARVAVFPMISGAGVKNKLLEAAALAKPILASPRCLFGLAGKEIPIEVQRRPSSWAMQLTKFWEDAESCTRIGEKARAWVETHHQWRKTAEMAERLLENIRVCDQN